MIVKLTVKHNFLKNQFLDIRFDDQMTVKDVKSKIYQMTGTIQKNQKIVLKKGENNIVVLNDKHKLCDYNCQNGMQLMVYDQNLNSVTKFIAEANLDEVPLKFASDEMYAKCENNVMKQIERKMQDADYREFIQQQQLARKQIQELEEQQAKNVQLGQKVWLDGKTEYKVQYIGLREKQGAGIYYGLVDEDGEIIYVKFCEFTLDHQDDGEVDEL